MAKGSDVRICASCEAEALQWVGPVLRAVASGTRSMAAVSTCAGPVRPAMAELPAPA